MTALRSRWTGNPLNSFLQTHDLSPTQFSIAAGINYTIVYESLNGYVRQFSQPIIDAIDSLDGPGTGEKVNSAYQAYRVSLAHSLLTKA